MDDQAWLAERFEANRAHLRAAAYRMLVSLSEAEDVVQEAWVRFNRVDTGGGAIDAIADPARLHELEPAVFAD